MKTSMGSIIPQFSSQKLLAEVSSMADLPSPEARRKNLILEMGALNEKGLNCFNCSGLCCTNEHNSMQVDPIQALELMAWLEGEGRLDQSFEDSIESTISNFRLDKEFFLGRGREFRKSFTCPFYAGKTKGCTVSRGAKPYGCLGFNPLEEDVAVPGKCSSNTKVLLEREESFADAEEVANKFLKEKLKIYWNKKNLPFALKDMLRALRSLNETKELRGRGARKF